MSIFSRFFSWVGSLLAKAKDGLAKASVVILDDIKPVLDGSAADIIASILDAVTKSKLPDTILEQLRKWVPVFLTANGIIQTLTPDSTEAEIEAELNKLVGLFPTWTPAQKAQYFTSVAANIYILLHGLDNGEKITFGEAAAIVEEFYDSLQKAKA
jgi:hypothetical protein